MRVKGIRQGEMVLITWQDITSDSAWKPEFAKDSETTQVKTLGFFKQCRKNKKTKIREVIINHSITEDGDADYTAFPEGCVIKIEKVDIKEV